MDRADTVDLKLPAWMGTMRDLVLRMLLLAEVCALLIDFLISLLGLRHMFRREGIKDVANSGSSDESEKDPICSEDDSDEQTLASAGSRGVLGKDTPCGRPDSPPESSRSTLTYGFFTLRLTRELCVLGMMECSFSTPGREVALHEWLSEETVASVCSTRTRNSCCSQMCRSTCLRYSSNCTNRRCAKVYARNSTRRSVALGSSSLSKCQDTFVLGRTAVVHNQPGPLQWEPGSNHTGEQETTTTDKKHKTREEGRLMEGRERGGRGKKAKESTSKKRKRRVRGRR